MTKHIWVNSIDEATLAILDNYDDLATRMKTVMHDLERPLSAELLADKLQTNMDQIVKAVNSDSRMVFLPNGDIWLPPTSTS